MIRLTEAENNINTNSPEGKTNQNCERLTVDSQDKEMSNLRKWFTDKLSLSFGNIAEKPKV